jgi:hypothetical protein
MPMHECQIEAALAYRRPGQMHELGGLDFTDAEMTGSDEDDEDPYEFPQARKNESKFPHGACGTCGADKTPQGRALWVCSKCNVRKYCSKEWWVFCYCQSCNG